MSEPHTVSAPAKESYPRGFHFLTGDRNWLDYGGVWSRHVADKRFHFIELTNMDEACGRDNAGHPTYDVQLSEVDLDTVPSAEVASAMQCCGLDRHDVMVMGMSAEALAETVRSYGVSSPLHSVSSNNAHKAIAECRAESYRLTQDETAYEAAMSRPVNALGSTAREFGQGDLHSALLRGIREGNASARIIGKMYDAANGQTLGGAMPARQLAEIRESLKR